MVDGALVKNILNWQKEHRPKTEFVLPNNEVECNCGMEVIKLTRKEIRHLLKGGQIWVECNDGEYSHIITIED